MHGAPGGGRYRISGVSVGRAATAGGALGAALGLLAAAALVVARALATGAGAPESRERQLITEVMRSSAAHAESHTQLG